MYSVFESKKLDLDHEKQLKSWKKRHRIEQLIKAGSENPDYYECRMVTERQHSKHEIKIN